MSSPRPRIKTFDTLRKDTIIEDCEILLRVEV
jgi:hypothetical protein